MAKVARAESTATSTLRIGLFDPGMTILHRVGLGGLYLTLQAIEQQDPLLHDELRALGGTWTLGPQTVEFTWSGDGKAFFRRLIRESFRLTSDGRIWFLGLGHPDGHGDHGVTLQEALLNTFLQHPKTREADPTANPGGALAVELDEQIIRLRFRRVKQYAHQGVEMDLTRPKEVMGGQFPGGAVRHNAFATATSLREPPGQWLPLLFGPVGAVYFRIRKRTSGIRPQFCIALPDVANLAAYARARSLFVRSSVRDLVVSGTADAALRVLAELEAANLLRDLRTACCQVASFGVVQWNQKQKTRVEVFEVEQVGSAALAFYRAAVHLLPAVRQEAPAATPSDDDSTTTGQPYWETAPPLDLMAHNLARGQPWWRDFASLVVDPEKWKQMRSYRILLSRAQLSRTGGLAAVVNQPHAFGDQGAEIIVRACHEAWRRRMGALAARAKERREPFGDLVQREFERLRIGFAHCKNAASLRAALTDFWSRAGGPIPELQQGWQAVLPYLVDDKWQLARDLALLALVSYAPEKEETTEGDLGR